jgi:hypothetical protein
MSPVDENDEVGVLQERAAGPRNLRKPSYGRGYGARPDPAPEPAELTQAETGLLHSQVPGHRWNGWCRMTGDEDYYAACSCGWRSTDTGDVSLMLVQVRDHLDAVRQSRGWPPSARARYRSGPGAATGEIVHLDERARRLRATGTGEQTRVSRTLRHSRELLTASAEQADRLVTELERERSARTGASGPDAEIVQRKVERARDLRKAIAAAAAALAVITEEIAEVHLETSR